MSAVQKTDKIENYYGFTGGINGKELFEKGINQAKQLGINVKQEEVIKIEINEKGMYQVTTSHNNYLSHTVILATGNKKNRPNIKKIEQFEGKGVSYCAICDGFFYRNKDVAVVGNGNYAISETNDLINTARSITILTNGKPAPEIRADNVTINEKTIQEIEGNEKVEEVRFQDGSNLKIDGLFVAEGVAGSSDFAKKLGALTKSDKIIVNENMETNVKGLYACRRLYRRFTSNFKSSV